MLSRQEANLYAQTAERAAPLVGCATGFHDDQGHTPVGKPALKLDAREASGFHHTPVFIGNDELEDRLFKIDGNGSSINVGLLC